MIVVRCKESEYVFMNIIYLFLKIPIIYVQLMNLRFIEIIRSNTLYVNWWKIVNLNNVLYIDFNGESNRSTLINEL